MVMRNYKLNILIILFLIGILFYISFLFGKQFGEQKTMDWALQKQNEIEERHLEFTRGIIGNYNDLQDSYDELYMENLKLKEDSEIIWQEFICTGYSTNDGEQGTDNIVATNFNLDWENVKNIPIIATDPKVIPLYSIIEIKGMGAFISLDTGGVIKGNRIDILFDSKEEALNFGVQEKEVRVIK